MAAPWHAGRDALERVVCDLIRAEFAALRPGAAGLPLGPWPASQTLGEDGLGLDSLERLSVAGALSEALHLHESGLEDLLLAHRTVAEWIEVCGRSLAHADTRRTFRTSGSQGTPKCCTHALADLEREVAYLATQLSPMTRVVAAVPAHHIYGFMFTVLLPQRLDLPVVDGRCWTPQAFKAALKPGDLVVSHPAHWALVARHAEPFGPGIHGLTSTAPCPPEVAHALVHQGLERLVQIYGSSETSGIGWRDTADAPYALMPFWQRDGARLMRAPVDGGPAVEAALQDHLSWVDDQHFVVAGRLDAAVQVAGHNVFPAQVRAALCEHRDVRDAAVRLMAPHEGQRLKCFVVPEPAVDIGDLEQRLSAHMAGRLAPLAQPRAYRFGPTLPVNAQGKACDWSLQTADDTA